MLTEELRALLLSAGAALVGVADLSGVPGCPWPRGVSVALPLPPSVLEDIADGPTLSYYEAYHALNRRLDRLVTAGADFLRSRGHAALAQTTDAVVQDETWRTPLPHKTVAHRAGLGWIGKNNLLVTPEYGSALRLSSLVTDAPLACAPLPAPESRCGGCRLCRDACPAHAIYGTLWREGTDRDEMFDRTACMQKQLELMKARTGMETDLCGQCFVVCPYTRRYLNQARK